VNRGDGKIATAPCGHPGEIVVGTFVRCLYGCKDDSKVTPHCPKCFSTEIEPYEWIVDLWSNTKKRGMHCVPCGHVWS
jgi:hypothetical protein